jgi:ketosteroid isomerase-like protein
MPDTSAADATLTLVQRFESAYNQHDVDGLMSVMTDDCTFEIVAPVQEGGGRWEGRAAVRTALSGLQAAFPGYVLETEEVFACGDRCAHRWVLSWDEPGGTRGRHRGIDTCIVRNGKIARKYVYIGR